MSTEVGHALGVSTQNPVFPTYARAPLTIVKGEGSWLWDDKGNKYLDFMTGIAVTNLGHGHPKVKAAVAQQLEQLWHISNLYNIPGQQRAAQLIVDNSCADAVFFCNSGAEANEAAIKLARRYQQLVKKSGRYEIITFKQSFHGRTLATLTATGQDKVKEGFHPLPEGFVTLEINDIEALKQAMNERTAAIMLEVVLAEGGILLADTTFLKQAAELCKSQGVLLIIDEIQTGMGRTGTLFGYEQFGIEPDIFTMAKGLGNGFPVGAMAAKEELREAFIAGAHGSTFGGNPLAVAAVEATLQTFVDENVVATAKQRGEYLHASLKEALAGAPQVEEIRGLGLIVGIACNKPVADYVAAARDKGLLVIVAGPNVIRLLPHLLISEEEIDQAVAVLKEVLTK